MSGLGVNSYLPIGPVGWRMGAGMSSWGGPVNNAVPLPEGLLGYMVAPPGPRNNICDTSRKNVRVWLMTSRNDVLKLTFRSIYFFHAKIRCVFSISHFKHSFYLFFLVFSHRLVICFSFLQLFPLEEYSEFINRENIS